MSEQPPIPPPTLTSTEIDLYCLECGYNLRGLSGDPRRCPECGHLNPVNELILPAELIRKQLRKLETAPTLCVGAGLIALAGLCWGALIHWHPRMAFYELGPLRWWSVLLLGLCAWLPSALAFRATCRGQTGWGMALLNYHLCAVPLTIFIILWFIAGIGMPDMLAGAVPWLPVLAGSVPCVVWPILAAAGGALAHFWIKRSIESLQREVAVEMARRWLRKKLSRPGH